MKIKLLVSLSFSLVAITAFAQENDDLYFNATDRAKLASQQAAEQSSQVTPIVKPIAEEQSENDYDNPTDSYSSRAVNPEFAARANASVASEDDGDYFVNDYQYNTQNKLKNFNNNYNSWSNSQWYSTNYYGPSINRWNSPYYGYNNPYSSPWADPYWSNSGWSASFSYSWGNNYGYWNNPYCYNPYSYYNYSPYYSYGWNPYSYYNSYGSYYGSNYGYGYGYPRTIVVVNEGNGSYPRYGKRTSRSSEGTAINSNSGPSRSSRQSVYGNAGGNSRSDNYTNNGRQSQYTNTTPAAAPIRNITRGHGAVPIQVHPTQVRTHQEPARIAMAPATTTI
jgi:hypothetical protein